MTIPIAKPTIEQQLIIKPNQSNKARVIAGKKAAILRGYESLSAAGKKGAQARSHESRVAGGKKAAITRGRENLAAAGKKGGEAKRTNKKLR